MSEVLLASGSLPEELRVSIKLSIFFNYNFKRTFTNKHSSFSVIFFAKLYFVYSSIVLIIVIWNGSIFVAMWFSMLSFINRPSDHVSGTSLRGPSHWWAFHHKTASHHPIITVKANYPEGYYKLHYYKPILIIIIVYPKGYSCFQVWLQNQVSVANSTHQHKVHESLHDIETGGLKLSAPPVSPEYHYYNQTLSWGDARSFCRIKHSDLATVSSMEEARLLAQTAAGRGDAWIGLRINGPAKWLWSDGSGEPSSTFWMGDEPNFVDGPDPCVEMQEGGWNDILCTTARPLVCEGGESKPFLCDLRFTKFHLQFVNNAIQTSLNRDESTNVMDRVHVRDFPNRGPVTRRERSLKSKPSLKEAGQSTRNKLWN